MSKLVLDFTDVGKPTVKMSNFAISIHSSIKDGVSMLDFIRILDSFSACKAYIEKHKSTATRTWESNGNFYSSKYDPEYGDYGNPFACPGSDRGMSCYDYGIYPWGDS